MSRDEMLANAARAALELEWLERASDLLAEPDPGLTPMLVDEVIADQAIVAVAGRWKTTKTYALLDMAISVVTGTPFLRRLDVANPGPVILVSEESGRKALWRRLDSLSRGRSLGRHALTDLHYAANKRVRLDDLEWQKALLEAGRKIRPRLIILDPLARLKSPGRNENVQNEYGILIEYLRLLRDETGSGVAFVQHTGHTGEHMRGTSDLESVWESRLGFTKDTSKVTITTEHREAEAGPKISYRLDWDERTRTIRLEEIPESTPAKVGKYMIEHPEATANEVYEAVGGRKTEVLREVKRQREKGGSQIGNQPGTTLSDLPSAGSSPDTPFRGSGTTTPGGAAEVVPASGTSLRNEGYEDFLVDLVRRDVITTGEALERQRVHELIVESR